jgi:hypothetical protein
MQNKMKANPATRTSRRQNLRIQRWKGN